MNRVFKNKSVPFLPPFLVPFLPWKSDVFKQTH